MTSVICSSCRFYGTAQTCRRHAPVVPPPPPSGVSRYPERQWPITHPTDWCGDHEFEKVTVVANFGPAGNRSKFMPETEMVGDAGGGP